MLDVITTLIFKVVIHRSMEKDSNTMHDLSTGHIIFIGGSKESY